MMMTRECVRRQNTRRSKQQLPNVDVDGDGDGGTTAVLWVVGQ
jgi:hypothetical protein